LFFSSALLIARPEAMKETVRPKLAGDEEKCFAQQSTREQRQRPGAAQGPWIPPATVSPRTPDRNRGRLFRNAAGRCSRNDGQHTNPGIS